MYQAEKALGRGERQQESSMQVQKQEDCRMEMQK